MTYNVFSGTLNPAQSIVCCRNTLHYMRFFRWPKKQLQGPPWREKTTGQYLDTIAEKDVF